MNDDITNQRFKSLEEKLTEQIKQSAKDTEVTLSERLGSAFASLSEQMAKNHREDMEQRRSLHAEQMRRYQITIAEAGRIGAIFGTDAKVKELEATVLDLVERMIKVEQR